MRQGYTTGLCALALTLLTATPALAGDYTVHSCKEEAGAPVHPIDGWRTLGSATAETVGQGCFRGGSMFARLPARDYLSGAIVGWQFDAPAGTEIVNYRISRSVVVGKPSAGGGAPAYYLTWPRAEPADIREQCVQPACASLGRRDRAVPENITTPPLPMAGVPSVFLVVGCSGPAGARCLGADAGGGDPVRLDIHASQITLRDASPPAVAAVSGPLADGRTQSGSSTVTARATDSGGGVAVFALEVDGRVVASAPAPGCQAPPFTAPVPCPLDITQALTLDTNTLAYGRHTARVVVTDVSGNVTGSAPFTVRVDNRRRAAHAATLSFSYSGRPGGIRFRRLTAKRVPRGSKLELRCRGRGCPFKTRRVVRSTKRSTHSLLRPLKGRTLRPGIRLQVRITGPDSSVQRQTFTVRRGKEPRRVTRCREGARGAKFRRCT